MNVKGVLTLSLANAVAVLVSVYVVITKSSSFNSPSVSLATLYETADYGGKQVNSTNYENSFQDIAFLLREGNFPSSESKSVCINGIWLLYPYRNFQIRATDKKILLMSGIAQCIPRPLGVEIKSMQSIGSEKNVESSTINLFSKKLFASKPVTIQNSENGGLLPLTNYHLESLIITGKDEWLLTAGKRSKFCFRPKPLVPSSSPVPSPGRGPIICIKKHLHDHVYFGHQINIRSVSLGCGSSGYQTILIDECYELGNNGQDRHGLVLSA